LNEGYDSDCYYVDDELCLNLLGESLCFYLFGL